MRSAADSLLALVALAAMVAVPIHIAWQLVAGALDSPLRLADTVHVAAAYGCGAWAGHFVARVWS